jgi:hypothetical protein
MSEWIGKAGRQQKSIAYRYRENYDVLNGGLGLLAINDLTLQTLAINFKRHYGLSSHETR